MLKVISIASVSGGGKTTIINELGKKLDNSAVIYFDDYSFVSLLIKRTIFYLIIRLHIKID